jgi:uncharacterized radical SAM superfamily protein
MQVEGHELRTLKARTTDIQKAVEAFRKRYPNAHPASVDGRYIMGTCEGCGKVLLESHTYVCSEDDVKLCMECAESLKG